MGREKQIKLATLSPGTPVCLEEGRHTRNDYSAWELL